MHSPITAHQNVRRQRFQRYDVLALRTFISSDKARSDASVAQSRIVDVLITANSVNR